MSVSAAKRTRTTARPGAGWPASRCPVPSARRETAARGAKTSSSISRQARLNPSQRSREARVGRVHHRRARIRPRRVRERDESHPQRGRPCGHRACPVPAGLSRRRRRERWCRGRRQRSCRSSRVQFRSARTTVDGWLNSVIFALASLAGKPARTSKLVRGIRASPWGPVTRLHRPDDTMFADLDRD